MDDGLAAPDPDGAELFGLTLLLQRLAHDQSGLLDGLARSLGAALPDAVHVRHRGLFDTGRAQALEIHLDDEVFELRDDRGRITAQVGRVVGGVAISHERCPIGEWLTQLRRALEESAQRSVDIAAALGRLS